jgi:sulfite exporter TauE/SafE
LDNNKPEKDGNFKAIRPINRITGLIFGLVGLLVLGYFILKTVSGVAVPEINQGMSYGFLFIVGLLTGFHCIAMCGGFVIGFTARDAQESQKTTLSPVIYGLGKIVSYTVIGGIFGWLGSIIAFTPLIRGIVGITAGVLLVIYGINLMNFIPWLRRLWIKPPKFVLNWMEKNNQKSSPIRPLVVGLLNGLMIACGPLQAIYILAAGTGNALDGAKLLFIFALGTLPVMIGFGYLTTLISHKMTGRLFKISGVLVLLLGLVMLNQGLVLTGSGFDFNSLLAIRAASTNSNATTKSTISTGYQTIKMDVTASGWKPAKFILQEGLPVKWVIDGKEITECNKAIQVPKLGLNFYINPGEQTIEFTPTEEGVIPWSCWMGMIDGSFIVQK